MNASGTSGNPITYDGNTAGTWGTGKAIVNGSEPLTGWVACTGPTDGRNNPNWANVYKIALPAGVTTLTANLYENNVLLALSQEPNAPNPMFYDDRTSYMNVPYAQMTDTPTEVTINDPSFLTQSDPNYWDGGFIHIWHNPNIVTTLAVTAFDPGTDTLTVDPLPGGNVYTDRDTLYAMANCLPILDTAGEYVVDETNNMIYLWPLSGANPDGSNVTVSIRKYGLSVAGNNYITIDGFATIKHSADIGEFHQGGGIRSHMAATGLRIRNNDLLYNRSMEKYAPIYVVDGTDVVIEDNYIAENVRSRGIMVHDGVDCYVNNNTLYRNGGTGISFHGVVGGSINGNLITEHTGAHANGISPYLFCDGIDIIGNTVKDGTVAITTQDADNITIAYNVFHTTVDSYTYADWAGGSHTSTNLHFYNNVFMNDYAKAVSTGENSRSGLIFRNNIADGANLGTGGSNITNNIYTSLFWTQDAQYGWSLGTGEIIETDKSLIFVDAATHDYHLIAGSTAYNAGTDVGYSEDIEGTAVPQGGVVDIGAYECVTGGNQPPVADAGPDQNVTDTDENGSEDVTLDGSGSYDTDGTITDYDWEEASVPIATGVSPIVTLTVAVHTIDLTVTDNDTATDSDSVVIDVQAPAGPGAAFIVGNTSLGDGDIAVNSALAGLGYTVTIVDDDVATAADANGMTVVVISASVNGNILQDTFRAVTVPVVTWEKDIYDDMDLTTSQGTQNKQTEVDIVDSGHPMAAGLSGTVTINAPKDNSNWGVPTVNADVVATIPVNSSRPVLFGYEAAAIMANGYAAPSRRVGVFMDADSASKWTADGQDLFEAAVTWAANATPPAKKPPTADAGPDQNVTDTDDGGDEDVTLDGSASDDSDGTIVSYEWEEATVPIATGVSPLVTLSVAVHTIDLIVTDDDTDTDTDSVVITVNPYVNVPPTADAGPDQNVEDTDEGGDEDVTLDGSGSSDSDGTIVSYEWEEATVPIATGVSPLVTLTVAVHTIDLIVTDDDTDTDTDSVVITVTSPGANIPPTADAGPDQNVTDTDEGGDEDVTLDGSASDDPDGTIVSYEWEEATVPIATGVSPLVTLTVAVHTIDLIVTDDDTDTDTDSVVITVEAPVTSDATLTVVETAGDYYTVTAHDSVTPAIEYWEVKVDIQSGGLFSFKDLTDAGDGGGGNTSYLGTDGYGRECSLIYFDGRGGNVLSRRGSLLELSSHLTFETAGDNSSFTITYAEDGSTTDFFHDSYSAGDETLSPGDLVTTITLVITPPDANGTFWDWTVSGQNVSGHALSGNVWAQEWIYSHIDDTIVKTTDTDASLTDGAWNESSPVSFARRTIGSNPALGLTQGRQIIIDRQSGFSGLGQGGDFIFSTHSTFEEVRYRSPYDNAGPLPDAQARVNAGQVIIDITDGGDPPSNIPPTADAGPDQNVTDTDDGGDEDVTLDGSASDDPDGTIVSYEWEEATVPIATGVSPLVTLSVAVHTIDLIVTDDDTDTDTDSVVITVAPYSAGEVLFVTGSGTLGTADQVVADLLTAMDYTVTPVDDGVATAGDATGKSLVVISATVNGNLVGAEFRTVTVPVLTWEKDIMDDMDLTTAQGTDGRETDVDILDPGHAMAAGLSGTVTVYSPRETVTYGVPTVAADVVASVAGTSSEATLFGYDTSDVMANGYVAPARRVGVFLDANSAEDLTTDGSSLVDAALSWALGL